MTNRLLLGCRAGFKDALVRFLVSSSPRPALLQVGVLAEGDAAALPVGPGCPAVPARVLRQSLNIEGGLKLTYIQCVEL